jgi:hypothetical protein
MFVFAQDMEIDPPYIYTPTPIYNRKENLKQAFCIIFKDTFLI